MAGKLLKRKPDPARTDCREGLISFSSFFAGNPLLLDGVGKACNNQISVFGVRGLFLCPPERIMKRGVM
jgi:hypothetical protein